MGDHINLIRDVATEIYKHKSEIHENMFIRRIDGYGTHVHVSVPVNVPALGNKVKGLYNTFYNSNLDVLWDWMRCESPDGEKVASTIRDLECLPNGKVNWEDLHTVDASDKSNTWLFGFPWTRRRMQEQSYDELLITYLLTPLLYLLLTIILALLGYLVWSNWLRQRSSSQELLLGVDDLDESSEQCEP